MNEEVQTDTSIDPAPAEALTAVASAVSVLIENLKTIASEARHAADPREPAKKIADALSDYFSSK